MKKNRFYFANDEWKLVIHSLNVLRTKLLSEGQYTDIVDEALFKVMSARIRKIEIAQPKQYT
ncbi:MAG: hypothetical protein ABF449_05360 [Ethanoligenens sp.]